MEHQITAPLDGTVTEVLASEGDQVDNGQLLVVVSTEE
ncbi:MAG: biotin/lipoyl-binding protein [Actinomycetota bacterium]|nr:biotin/lipoyl-binding protein [Actinomycetota bacterium]